MKIVNEEAALEIVGTGYQLQPRRRPGATRTPHSTRTWEVRSLDQSRLHTPWCTS